MVEDLIGITRVYGRTSATTLSAEVSIFKPKQVNSESWSCTFFISGLTPVPRQAVGVDGVQALLMALEGVARVLDDTGDEWFAEAHCVLPDWFPRRVLPTGYGQHLDRHMRGIVQEEITRLRHAGTLGAFREAVVEQEATSNQALLQEASAATENVLKEE